MLTVTFWGFFGRLKRKIEREDGERERERERAIQRGIEIYRERGFERERLFMIMDRAKKEEDDD